MAERSYELLVEDVIHTLAEALDLHRDDEGRWWANDWMDEVVIPADEARVLAIVLKLPPIPHDPASIASVGDGSDLHVSPSPEPRKEPHQ